MKEQVSHSLHHPAYQSNLAARHHHSEKSRRMKLPPEGGQNPKEVLSQNYLLP